MRIAIAAPSPVPFVMGGAENLWLGLQRFINGESRHECELIKLPVREGSLAELIDAYAAFARLDVGSFDTVISGKYPAWMTQHRNHRLYMLHTLRGLYDTYHLMGEPTEVAWPASLRPLVGTMDRLAAAERADNDGILDCLAALRAAVADGTIDAHAGRFPGPLSRAIVHRLDALAMAPGRIAGYAAISRTVRRRAGYFPPGADVAVAYPPPAIEGFHCRGDEFLFTSSRLDGPKRVGLLIEAMRHVTAGIRLLIGGTGPDEARLRALAGDDDRIVFLGRLGEAELVEHYANALAVCFVPQDEDYGLVTIEAMKSRKPVITVDDAGGVTEFVIPGETGLSTPPDPRALAAAIDHVAGHREEAREMGRNAERLVAGITWDSVAKTLIGKEHFACPASRPAGPRRKRMVVATTFGIHPPRGGGQSRVFHLYRAWAERHDVTIVSLGGVGDGLDREIAPGLREIRIAKTAAHEEAEVALSAAVDWLPVTDIVASRLVEKTPEFEAALREACRDADIVVASHPYWAALLRAVAPEAPLWLEVQDVEAPLKARALPPNETGERLLHWVREDEANAWRSAAVAFACTAADLDEMDRLYGPGPAVQVEIPNGFAPEEVDFVAAGGRMAVKRRLGLAGRPTALFVGSWHDPNIAAIRDIIAFAAALPDVVLLIVGSAGRYFSGRPVPANVRLLGALDEAEKRVALAAADLALNPMSSGSGSNLKMFEYFAAGIPVLTTPFGLRGMDDELRAAAMLAEIDQFVEKIVAFFVEMDDGARDELVRRARALVAKTHAWPVIAARGLAAIEDRLAEGAPAVSHPDAPAGARDQAVAGLAT